MELDHLFLRAAIGGPEAEALRRFGLLEGSANVHPGQGTANRRFFFRNAFLELLWIADEEEVASARTRPTRLAERLGPGSAGVSPFGICFRASAGELVAPFPAWDYTPAYLPEGMAIEIGRDTPLAEPMWFFFAAATAPSVASVDRRQPLDHPAGLGEITALRVTVPGGQGWSGAARMTMAGGQVSMVEGDAHLLEICFDGEVAGKVQDFRPALPLVFRY